MGKLIYNSVFNTISALVQLDNTRIQMTNWVMKELIRPAMKSLPLPNQ